MRDDERPAEREHDALDPVGSHDPDAEASPSPQGDEYDPLDESLTEELAALIDDGRTYAEAELAFQKTRAKFAGKSVGAAAGFLVVAIVTLHIAVLALAVGMLIALQPLVTIWGAIAIVVGALLVATALLVLAAKRRADRLKLLFGSEGDQ